MSTWREKSMTNESITRRSPVKVKDAYRDSVPYEQASSNNNNLAQEEKHHRTRDEERSGGNCYKETTSQHHCASTA